MTESLVLYASAFSLPKEGAAVSMKNRDLEFGKVNTVYDVLLYLLL